MCRVKRGDVDGVVIASDDSLPVYASPALAGTDDIGYVAKNVYAIYRSAFALVGGDPGTVAVQNAQESWAVSCKGGYVVGLYRSLASDGDGAEDGSGGAGDDLTTAMPFLKLAKHAEPSREERGQATAGGTSGEKEPGSDEVQSAARESSEAAAAEVPQEKASPSSANGAAESSDGAFTTTPSTGGGSGHGAGSSGGRRRRRREKEEKEEQEQKWQAEASVSGRCRMCTSETTVEKRDTGRDGRDGTHDGQDHVNREPSRPYHEHKKGRGGDGRGQVASWCACCVRHRRAWCITAWYAAMVSRK